MENWQYFFGKMEEHFKTVPFITRAEAQRWITGDFAITPSTHRQQHVAKREPYGFRMGGKAQAYSEQPIRRRVRHCSEQIKLRENRRSLSKNNK